jgi:DNA-binding NtrC family response regulator
VDSEPERGSTFKVYLPRHEHRPPAVDPASAERAAKGGTEIVLLVEDEQAVRSLARIVLERAGYTVVEAANPAEAELRWASIACVDLLLTDVVMPGGTGPDLYRLLSARQPHLRVLFMSGYADWDLFDRAAIARSAAFLEKPFLAASLLDRVRQVLDRGVS